MALRSKHGYDAVSLASEAKTQSGTSVYAGARWSSIRRASVQGVRFLSSLVLFKILGPSNTGLMNMALIVTGLLDQLRDFGTAQIVVQRKEVHQDFLSTVFFVNCAIGLILGGALYGGSDMIAEIMKDTELAPIIRTLGPLFVFTTLGATHRSIISRNMQIDRLAKSDVAGAVVYAVCAIALALAGFRVWSLVIALLVSNVVITTLLWSGSGWRPSLVFEVSSLREIAKSCMHMMGFNVLNYGFSCLDRFLIGRYYGREALGLYSFAYYLTMFPARSVTSTLVTVLLPALSRMQEDNSRMADRFCRALQGIALITFPMIVGIAVVAEPLVGLLWGDKWVSAVPLIPWIAAIAIVMSLANTTGAVYVAKGRTGLLLKCTIGFGLVNATALLIGKQWDVQGLVITYSLVTVMLGYLHFAIPMKLLGQSATMALRGLVPFLVGVALMGASAFFALLAVRHFSDHLAMALLISVLVGIVTYCAFIALVRPPALSDLRRVLEKKKGRMAI